MKKLSVLEANQLSRWYGDVIAVNNLTVEVGPGITGLLGPNGAGKSTLMRMGMGLIRPSNGSIKILDEQPWDNSQLLNRIGYLPEGDAPWRDETGHRSALMAARFSGLSGQAAEDAVARSLKAVGLESAAEKKVAAYSRGMQQRFKFALALLHEPEFYILDEPLLGTDPLTRRDLIQLMRDMANQGKSILVSTHVLPDVEALTQKILLLNHGRLMAYGEVGEIRDLLDQYPRTVRIGTPRPRDLGQSLWGWPSVLSLQAEDNAVIVRTRNPQDFYKQLQDHLVQSNVPVTSVTSPDDSVEAVFRYLVG